MKTYKLYKTTSGQDAVITVNDDGSMSSFLLGVDNPEEKAYLAWLELGNTPLPADKEQT